METTTPLLNGAPPTTARSFKEAKSVFWIETVKMWKIAGLIALQIICQYGTNSFTNIFVGHIGNVELSAVTISLTVIGTFSFGFLLHTYISGFLFVSCMGLSHEGLLAD